MNKTFNQGKDEIAKLCQYFANNHQEFLAPGVKEAHVRQILIDPFFEALGWDVRNTDKVAPQYREVMIEDSLDVEGHQKAPDYSFRVGTLPKFYTEAKKCGVNISSDPAPAYQLRRYGWSAKVVLSILTDFEEFSIYDCTKRPNPKDKASYSRMQYYHFEQYPDCWREIWDIFSREAVWSGAFDKYSASKRKRGTSEVDTEFLKEIEGWRDALARNIALRNKDLSSDDLNAAVQRTIDRIVFLRMAEDRGIEPYEQLLKLCERPNIYKRFMSDLCNRADEKYNSGLFHFQKEKGISEAPDQITPRLKVDDKTLKPILKNLYFAHGSPYHFGVLPVEILGTVYERFLGKVIRLTAGHQAKIEEKPEVRKAGGVYYTPSYIVDYIVKNTVGVQVEGKSPKQLAGNKTKEPFRVLDMACGSGSFLLGAYKYLLDHCLKWYTAHNPTRYKKAVYKTTRDGQWNLTIQEKKRILTTHIFGVDIDPQAVEVTKLSLLLKTLEGEDDASLSKQLSLFHDRALPNLSNSIKCGNSLVGSDYFNDELFIDPTELKFVNPFDWNVAFPEIIEAGGFDCVIGNPPYVFGRDWASLGISDYYKEYFRLHYKMSPYQLDMFSLFMENAFNKCKPQGYIGQIVPNVWLTNMYSSKTRALLLSKATNLSMAIPPPNVFPGITVDTIIYTLRKEERSSSTFGVQHIENCSLNPTSMFRLKTSDYINGERPISLSVSPVQMDLAQKLRDHFPQLGNIAQITRGVHPYRTGGYGKTAFGAGHQSQRDVIERPYHSKKRETGFRSFIYGKDLSRFGVLNPKEYIKYGPWLAEPRSPDFFEGERIYSRKILAERLVVTLETQESIADQQVYITKPIGDSITSKYLLGLMASRLIAFFIRSYFDEATQAFPQIKISQLRMLPIRMIDFTDQQDVCAHKEMIKLVCAMLNLNERLLSTESVATTNIVQRQIAATETKIDGLVYMLYSLTKKEIAIVEDHNP